MLDVSTNELLFSNRPVTQKRKLIEYKIECLMRMLDQLDFIDKHSEMIKKYKELKNV